MSKSKHTKGPWFFEESNGDYEIGVKGNDFDQRGLLSSPLVRDDEDIQDLDVPKDERLANARLIAAAPEMLEALELAKSELYAYEKSDPKGTVAMLEHLIAKAKGE